MWEIMELWMDGYINIIYERIWSGKSNPKIQEEYDVLRGKYSKAESNIMELKRLGATILHGVDAKTMMSHTDLKNICFDRIVFNFPHAGFHGKEDDLHMINLHKELMWYFFFNARLLLQRYGQIYVTHKTGYPYDKWDLVGLAAECSLVLVMKASFNKEDYPGYNQKRGDSVRCDEPFDLATACTFVFRIGDSKKRKNMSGINTRSVSNRGGSNVYPGQWTADSGSLHPPPLVEAWPPQPGQYAAGRQFPPPVNTDYIPLHPYHIPYERQQPGFPLNADGMVGDPYFHEHGTFCRTPSTPRPSLNDYPAIGTIPPPMGIITYPDLRPPPPMEHPWHEPRTVSGLPASDDYAYFTQEHQRSLQREYDVRRHLMPGSTSSSYSAFLEHRNMESVKKQEWLRSMIALYGRQ